MTSPVSRGWWIAAIATVLVWCGLELALRRPDVITDDWQGWRQADTQAIARSLAFEDFAPLRPRIDWRGDGPGFVETELQLYPAMIAVAMKTTGDAVWPGQLISLACVAAVALIVFGALARRHGGPPAAAALVALLSCKGAIVIGTSIQPDALALLAFTIGWFAFVADLAAPSRARLATWIAATAVAGLVKPTMLELGVAQFALVALAHRAALRTPRLWLGWAAILVVVGAFLLHARSLYVETGLTFGVLSGGDSKLPNLAQMASPARWIDLLRFELVWGIGALGAIAAGYLAARRKLAAEEAALALGALCSSLLAFRYASGPYGTHYHLPHVVLGAWMVARAAALVPARALVVAPVAALALTALAIRDMRALPPEPETALGAALAAHAAPGTLVVVRARAPAYDPEWGTANNFQDPRVFYGARTYGWVLANDQPGAAPLAELAAKGARFYVHVRPLPIDPELAGWLAAHAERVVEAPAGSIYRLK